MTGERINPVALVCGAASSIGAACARVLSERAEGGLILIDASEAGLDAVADALPRPPERVSTLAFDPSDRARWPQAVDFIAMHYGRLDWVVLAATGPPGLGLADLDATLLGLRQLMPLLRENNWGGAAVIVADARSAMKASLLQLTSVASKEGMAGQVRVNAVIEGGADAPAWRGAPVLHDAEPDALLALQRTSPCIARTAGYSLERLLPVLLSDRTALTGAALVVDDAEAL